ncbi:hypothetical protein [Chitinophaga solisilvae]|uniref:Uncharacterized protein n=1 Tax=Chitinophaga solisilvae TaxID=1233460 RepID=A0A9Q5CX20_9BACT|nr:hypothetical protein [Chitinophaga solisilvae]NSL85906.1 hypothetical protein [Chitinophaga solisilvae]
MKKITTKKLKLGKIKISNLQETQNVVKGGLQFATANTCYFTCTTSGTLIC